MLPEGWKVVPLREVVDPRRPITYGVVQPGPRLDAGTPIIRGKDYSSGVVDDSDLYLIGPEIAAKYKRSTVQGGDILVSIVGYLGQVAMVPAHLTGANLTQTTARVAVESRQDLHFFFHQLRGPQFAEQVRRYAKGSAQPGLNLADLEKCEVVVPPLVEQRRIAEILQAADAAVATAEAVIDQTEKVKRGLVEELLTRGMPGRHSRFKMTEIGELPESWRLTTLGSELETFSGGTPSRSTPAFFDGNIPWLKSGEIRAGEIWSTEEAISESAVNASATKVAPAGSVVLAMYGATAGVVGRLMIDAALNQAVLAFRESSTILPNYLRFLLEMLGPALLSRVQGSGQPNLSAGLVRSCACGLPPLDEQADIVTQIVALLDAVNEAKQTSESAHRVRQALAAELLSGRRKVQ